MKASALLETLLKGLLQKDSVQRLDTKKALELCSNLINWNGAEIIFNSQFDRREPKLKRQADLKSQSKLFFNFPLQEKSLFLLWFLY